MDLPRRRLLGLCAGSAVAMATSSCRGVDPHGPGATDRPTVGVASIRAPGKPTDTPRPQAFAGQPPPGSLYYGASVPYHRSLVRWESALGATLALNRSYFTPDADETQQLVTRCLDDLAHGRLPHVSIKPHGTWADVAAGRRDAWLAAMLGPLGEASGPVLFTLHHEPENDAGAPGIGSVSGSGLRAVRGSGRAGRRRDPRTGATSGAAGSRSGCGSNRPSSGSWSEIGPVAA